MINSLTKQTINELTRNYQKAKRRLLLLDYDGTLVDFAPTPEQAVPTPDVLNILRALAEDFKNTVVIVSGRDQQSLERWFGHLRVGLAAEHGSFIKQQNGTWQSTGPKINKDWQQKARELFEPVITAVPESFLEQKQTAFCWHYRNAPAHMAAQVMPGLLTGLAAAGLDVMQGDMVVEARCTTANKSVALQYWAANKKDFLLIAGDDTTDEAMFGAAPPHAVTVKIRPGSSQARYVLENPSAMRALLTRLYVAKTVY